MKNLNYKKVKGYIEGYYGKLLTWKERIELLDVLSKNNMNFYFYCPKEDINHRFKWKENTVLNGLKNFSKFNKYASEKNINVIAGISPGLDFNFKSYIEGNKEELYLLIKKFKTLFYHVELPILQFYLMIFQTNLNCLLKIMLKVKYMQE